MNLSNVDKYLLRPIIPLKLSEITFISRKDLVMECYLNFTVGFFGTEYTFEVQSITDRRMGKIPYRRKQCRGRPKFSFFLPERQFNEKLMSNFVDKFYYAAKNK